MKAMNPAQLAEAEHKVRQLLNKSQRIDPPLSANFSSDYTCSIVA
jgi:hypothetical protein